MSVVVALVPDLLLGSRVQGSLLAAGHEVELIESAERLRKRLADPATPPPAVLVVDLTDDRLGGPELVQSLSSGGWLAHTRTLGFYAHVDAQVRERAEQAGFDLVVARSRMAREGARLVGRLAGS